MIVSGTVPTAVRIYQYHLPTPCRQPCLCVLCVCFGARQPTPLYVMDEIDAALDFKNVSIVANYIKDRTKNAQFIIISLRNNMFELADRLIGIYKTHDVTKSVAINPKEICMGGAVDSMGTATAAASGSVMPLSAVASSATVTDDDGVTRKVSKTAGGKGRAGTGKTGAAQASLPL